MFFHLAHNFILNIFYVSTIEKLQKMFTINLFFLLTGIQKAAWSAQRSR